MQVKKEETPVRQRAKGPRQNGKFGVRKKRRVQEKPRTPF